MNGNKPILLIEDDEVDIQTIKRAFKDLSITNPMQICSNGEEGLLQLRDQSVERPCVILLDLNMPKMGGIEFMEAVQQEDKAIFRIPIIILTTSQEEEDKIKSYDHKIAGYIIKPVEYAKFVKTIGAIDLYWTISELPSS